MFALSFFIWVIGLIILNVLANKVLSSLLLIVSFILLILGIIIWIRKHSNIKKTIESFKEKTKTHKGIFKYHRSILDTIISKFKQIIIIYYFIISLIVLIHYDILKF